MEKESKKARKKERKKEKEREREKKIENATDNLIWPMCSFHIWIYLFIHSRICISRWDRAKKERRKERKKEKRREMKIESWCRGERIGGRGLRAREEARGGRDGVYRVVP